MTAYISSLSHDIIALITILNPIAAASIMIGMVNPPAPSVLRPIAVKAAITVVIASLVTLFSGEFAFKLFGINVMSIKVIGGIILMMIAINMANGQQSKARHSKEEANEAEDKDDVSVIPLGIPILFGPGVIATIIVLNNNHMQHYPMMISYALITIATFVAGSVVFVTLRYAGAINRALGVTGMKIMTRIMGLVVGAIAAQFIIGGVKGLWGTM